MMGGTLMPLPLDVTDLSTTLFTRRGEMKAVDGLSLAVDAGETVALVGESGCGKSLSALSIMRLLPEPPARIVGGTVTLNGRDLVALPEEAMLAIRGKEIGMICLMPNCAFLSETSRMIQALRSGDLSTAGSRRD